MQNKKYLMNDLITSLESFDKIENISDEELSNAKKELVEAQASFESYSEAFKIINDLDSKNILSMETYSAIMSITEQHCKVQDILNISMEDDSKPSMIKNIKDKLKAAFTFLVDKFKNLYSKVFKRTEEDIEKLKEVAKEKEKELSEKSKETVSQEAFGDMFKKKPLAVNKVYLFVDENGNLYPIEKLFDSMDSFIYGVGRETIDFIGDALFKYEKTFAIDTKSGNYGWSGFEIERAKELEKAFSDIGSKKYKAGSEEFVKADNLNAFTTFSFDEKAKLIKGAAIVYNLENSKKIGFNVKVDNVEKITDPRKNLQYIDSGMQHIFTNIDKMVKHNSDMKQFAFAMLDKMSSAVMKTIVDPKKELPADQYNEMVERIKISLLKPIEDLLPIVSQVLDLEGEFVKQMIVVLEY